MIPLPTRRWLWIAAGLAVVAPLALYWPGAAAALVVLDLLWVVAFWVDWSLGPDAADISVERVAPAAFSVGRSFPVRYRWSRRGAAPFTALVREDVPAPLIDGPSPRRRLYVPARGVGPEGDAGERERQAEIVGELVDEDDVALEDRGLHRAGGDDVDVGEGGLGRGDEEQRNGERPDPFAPEVAGHAAEAVVGFHRGEGSTRSSRPRVACG